MSLASSRLARRVLPVLLAGGGIAAVLLAVPSANSATSIEPYARYEGQTTCFSTARPGAVKLEAYLLRTYPTTGTFGITRACNEGGRSEHKEGRAIDWKVNVFDPRQEAAAQAFFAKVLATDAAGNRHALARRMGIMYLIYNRRIFEFYRPEAGWTPYTGDSPHTDHVHISLSRAGGDGRTSWYTGQGAVPAPPTPPGARPQPTNPPTGGTFRVTTNRLEGQYAVILRRGVVGPSVALLQRALRRPTANGQFGPATEGAVRAFQKRAGLPVTGVVNRATWVALQRELDAEARAIRAAGQPQLRGGARGPAVRALEAALNRPRDSVYDATDQRAVRQVQQIHGLPGTGVVDARTWKVLQGA